MSEAVPAPAPLTGGRRIAVSLSGAVHALVLGGAAALLPFRSFSYITLVLGALSLGHAATCAFAAAGREKPLAVAFRVTALASLGVFAAISFLIATCALYVRNLYDSLGSLIAGGLVVFWLVFVLLMVPAALWGLATTRGAFTAPKRTVPSVLAVLFLAAATSVVVSRTALATPTGAFTDAERRALLESAVARLREHAPKEGARKVSLFTTKSAACIEPVQRAPLTLLVTYDDGTDAPRVVCVQPADAASLPAALEKDVQGWAGGSSPLKFDWVVSAHALSATTPLLDIIKIRPEINGVCVDAQCLAPWQLVTLDAFTNNRPVAAVRDMSFGASLERIGEALGAPPDITRMTRIETASYLVDGGGIHAMRGLHEARKPVTREALERATLLAETHILSAQDGDGSFRYTLNPFSGHADYQNFNLRRQSGTTIALCERPSDPARVKDTALRSLAFLAALEEPGEGMSALLYEGRDMAVGDTAMGLAALLACHSFAGDKYDALIGRLGKYLMAAQRKNGSFPPVFEVKQAKAFGAGEGLFGSGQAILALVWLEKLAVSTGSPVLPPAAALHETVERAMSYYGGQYWPWPLKDLFYLEENWHCIAARAGLGVHRNTAYERFCIDYVTFKARLILNETDADPALVGAYGFGNVFPPHNTATAGYGEALSAGLAVAEAGGARMEPERKRLEKVLGFLLSMQWNGAGCFACATDQVVQGGFSEHYASPIMRIDYTQHALSALRHGGALLFPG